jgi:hypothetical protein
VERLAVRELCALSPPPLRRSVAEKHGGEAVNSRSKKSIRNHLLAATQVIASAHPKSPKADIAVQKQYLRPLLSEKTTPFRTKSAEALQLWKREDSLRFQESC